jgi:glutamate-1-semialdehyde 2,1-aminomutase
MAEDGMNRYLRNLGTKMNNRHRYKKSESHLKLAEQVIPLGSQTFSKSRTQYPVGVSPLYALRAKGCRIQDLDGNWYIDLVNGLAAITIGYRDHQINKAVAKQLAKGVIFSLPGVLEEEVASLIVSMVPSAELVRFGKNGSDATSAAVRLARAHTQREIVVVCGYHGWQDWFIGSTSRDKGVPKDTKALTKSFKYNDIDSLIDLIAKHPNEIAAVIMEPMNNAYPQREFLVEVRRLCSKNGIVLIFDETITGFRFSRGGAQEYFNVIPDLSTFGKGVANGFPLSVVTGKREIMMEMEEIFFSGTFGGELLSLAAAKVVLEKHAKKNITGKLDQKGKYLADQVNQIIKEKNLEGVLNLSGHPSWIFLNWKEANGYSVDEIKTFFMQEMFAHGILILNTHNISIAMSKRDLNKIVSAYDKTLEFLSRVLSDRNLREHLKVEPIKPLFKIR